MRTKELRDAIMRILRSRRKDHTGGLVDYLKEKSPELHEKSDGALRKKIQGILKEEEKKGNVKRCQVLADVKRKGEPYSKHVQGWEPKRKRRKAGRKPPVKYAERERHTRDLKRKIIRPWLNQLPSVSLMNVPPRELPVESHEFFDDFRKHVCREPNPYELLETYKLKVDELWSKRRSLSTAIEGLLGRLDLDPSLSGRVLEFALYWTSGGRDRDLLDFPLRHRQDPSQAHRANLTLRRAIKGGQFSAEAGEILQIVRELKNLVEKMRKVLEEHLNMTEPFPGDCELLK